VILWLALAAVVRLYHPETIDSMATSRHTHVRVSGVVTLVKREADGDVHIRLDDKHGHFIVAEIVPYHPLPRPRFGQHIEVSGIRRFDDEYGHGWWEIHVLEQWRVVPAP